MGVRSSFYHALVAVDRRLGLRDWLRRACLTTQEAGQHHTPDPFSVSGFQHPRPRTVLDIGGSHGQFAAEVFRAFPGVPVYSFEPIPACYEELWLMREQHPSLRPIQLALSDREGEVDFWLSRFRDSSSIQEMLPAHIEAWPHTEVEKKITVQVSRLDEVASRLELVPPIFVKLDVQGHELSVIRGGRETLSRCQRLMVECNFAPLYKGQPSFTQLYDELRSLGFLFDGFISPLRHPKTLEQLSADAVFYRPLETAEPE